MQTLHTAGSMTTGLVCTRVCPALRADNQLNSGQLEQEIPQGKGKHLKGTHALS